jgi:3,4-dihydroxy 2-butanone 4-phosphate synthase/GTP cyclohydrolase II
MSNVRFRIDGVMHDVYQIPTNVMAAVSSRIKIIGRMDVAEKRRPQDGRLKTRTPDGQEVELRLSTMPTAFGEFRAIAYEDTIDREVHVALVKGTPEPDRPTLVRVHVQNSICDLFDAEVEGCGWPLRSAMKEISDAGEGVIVVLRNHDTGRDFVSLIERIAGRARRPQQDQRRERRTLGAGAQILNDVGVSKMRVMSAPINLHGLHGFNLEVVEFVDHD